MSSNKTQWGKYTRLKCAEKKKRVGCRGNILRNSDNVKRRTGQASQKLLSFAATFIIW